MLSPLAALLIDWVLTAYWPLLAKDGFARFSSALFAHAGVLIGFLSLLPWLWGERWSKLLSPELRKPFFMMGLFGCALPLTVMFKGLEYTTPANGAIMAQVEVLYSAVLASWLLGERVGRRQAAASILVVAGTGLIVCQDLTSIRWKGDLLILLTPWMFQVSHIYAKRLPPELDAVTLSGARLFYGSLCFIPVSAAVLLGEPRWEWSRAGTALLLTQGLLMCSINHVLWYRAIRNMDLSKATAIMLSYPALTVVLSWTLGYEAPRLAQAVGLGLTFSGAFWLSRLSLEKSRIPAWNESPSPTAGRSSSAPT